MSIILCFMTADGRRVHKLGFRFMRDNTNDKYYTLVSGIEFYPK